MTKSPIWAAILSLLVGSLLLVAKFYAYKLTGSQAVLSDAVESIANVLTAMLATTLISIARQPADENHPYGHGKAEYFSSIFEGGLITFASVMIMIEVGKNLSQPHQLNALDFGAYIMLGAGIANLILGRFLIRIGKKSHSLALIASGHHVISDFWTSFGVFIGLLLIQWTGVQWLDFVAAALVSIYLGWTGIRLVMKSVSALMDETDHEVVKKFSELFTKHLRPGIIHIHFLRVIRSGDQHHVDAHLVVPEFWDVKTAHHVTNKFEEDIFADYSASGDIAFHLDPCRKFYCSACELSDCPIRQTAFKERRPFVIEELLSPTEPTLN